VGLLSCLRLLTQRVFESPPTNQAAGESKERFVDLVAAVGADEQAAAVVQPGEAALDDPALAAEPRAVLGFAAGDRGLDPSAPEQPPVLVVVVAAVGDEALGPSPRSADPPTHRRHQVEQREQLRDIVAVAARERPGQREAATLYEQVVLAAATAPVDRARTRLRAPFLAGTWLESAIARDQSRSPAACSSASSSSCSRCQTPASCQARSLRQAVIPQPKPSS
jgi:hypothetical protein